MDDLVQWLGEQLKADGEQDWHARGCESLPDPLYPDREPGACDCGVPARVLREIDAKRRTLQLHHSIELPTEMLDACAECEVTGAYPEYPCRTLRLLALPYVDRPGYREEWRL